jgi:hypothetical protein
MLARGGVNAEVDAHVTKKLAPKDQVTVFSDNIGETGNDGNRYEDTTHCVQIRRSAALGPLPLPSRHAADDAGGEEHAGGEVETPHLEHSGVDNLSNAPPRWALLEPGEKARRTKLYESFIGEQKPSDMYSSAADLIGGTDVIDRHVVRMVTRFGSVLEHMLLHGVDIDPSHVAKPSRRRRERHRARFNEQGVGDDDDHWGSGLSKFNLLRDNDVEMLEMAGVVYSKAAALDELEKRWLKMGQIGEEGNERRVLISKGDGAPVVNRTQPSGLSRTAQVLWVMGQWHKRNNFGGNVMIIYYDYIMHSILKSSGLHTDGRINFAVGFGHVRRSVLHLDETLTAVLMECVVEYLREECGMCMEDEEGGSDDDEDYEEEDDVSDSETSEVSSMETNDMSGSGSGSDSDSDGDNSRDGGGDGGGDKGGRDEGGRDGGGDDDDGGDAQLAAAAAALDGADEDEVEGSVRRFNEEFQVEQDVEQKQETGDDDNGGEGRGSGNVNVVITAIDVYTRFLKCGVGSLMGEALVNLAHALDVHRAFEDAWKLGNTGAAKDLYQWAVRASAPFDYAKGAEHYARLDWSQQLQYDCASLHTQLRLLMDQTMKGKTCNIASCFFVEQIQHLLKKYSKGTANPNLRNKWAETSMTLEAKIDESSATARLRGGEKPTHSMPTGRTNAAGVSLKRRMIRSSRILSLVDATVDRKGAHIPNSTLASVDDGTKVLSRVVADPACAGLATGLGDITELVEEGRENRRSLKKLETSAANVKASIAMKQERRKLIDVEKIGGKIPKDMVGRAGMVYWYTEGELDRLVRRVYLPKGWVKLKDNERRKRGGRQMLKLSKRPLVEMVARARKAAKRTRGKLQKLVNAEKKMDEEHAAEAGGAAEKGAATVSLLSQSLSRFTSLVAGTRPRDTSKWDCEGSDILAVYRRPYFPGLFKGRGPGGRPGEAGEEKDAGGGGNKEVGASGVFASRLTPGRTPRARQVVEKRRAERRAKDAAEQAKNAPAARGPRAHAPEKRGRTSDMNRLIMNAQLERAHMRFRRAQVLARRNEEHLEAAAAVPLPRDEEDDDDL